MRLICHSSELEERGRGLRFEVAQGGERLPAFLVRYTGGVYAYLNRCAHIGVELDWLPGEFFDDSRLYLVCATHGATYQPNTGRCVHGPCKGARLKPIDVVERDGGVYLKQDNDEQCE
jgi:nitrite reductase/ring-hydroxylating ferredoxin subunit